MNDTIIDYLNDCYRLMFSIKEPDVHRILFCLFTNTDKRRTHELYVTYHPIFKFYSKFLVYWDCLIVIIQYCDISFMLRVHESQHVQCNPPLLFFTFEILTFSFSLLHCCFSQNRYMSIEYGVSKSRYIDEGKGKD